MIHALLSDWVLLAGFTASVAFVTLVRHGGSVARDAQGVGAVLGDV